MPPEKSKRLAERMRAFINDRAAWKAVEDGIGRTKQTTMELDDGSPDFDCRSKALMHEIGSARNIIKNMVIGHRKGGPEMASELAEAGKHLSANERQKLEGLLERLSDATNAAVEKRAMHAWRTEPLMLCPGRVFREFHPMGGTYNPLEAMLTVPGRDYERVILPESIYESVRRESLAMLFFPGVSTIAPWGRGEKLTDEKLFSLLTKRVLTRRLGNAEGEAVSRVAQRLPKAMREEVMARLLISVS